MMKHERLAFLLLLAFATYFVLVTVLKHNH